MPCLAKVWRHIFTQVPCERPVVSDDKCAYHQPEAIADREKEKLKRMKDRQTLEEAACRHVADEDLRVGLVAELLKANK